MLLIIFLFLILVVIILFSFPRFSPIPYYPTNKKDMGLIVKCLNLKNNQIIIDLGAGDGVVIFSAAQEAWEKNLNTKFVAIEINIVLIVILYVRRFFHPNKNNIRIIWGDLFKITMKQYNNATIYLYISPWLIDRLIKNLKLEINNFTLVSYMYPIKSLIKKRKTINGHNNIYVYN